MTTPWTLPTEISQYSEPGAESAHISWDESKFGNLRNVDNRSVGTNGTLSHTARSPKHDTNMKTYFLKATGFNFRNVPDVVSGIEVRLTTRRFGRVTDDTIQLTLNDELIGINKANVDLTPTKIYGNETEQWNASLTTSSVTDPSFGIVIRFKSHPHWPHRDGAFIDAVEIRIH